MHTARRTFVATGTVALLAAAGVTAAIAADPAPPPPPRIAFVANGIVPADALAAGPIAGQLGAPIYTTQPDTLSPAAATGLDDYDPELVIVLGGPVAIHDTVIDQVEAATGLTESADATPAGGIVRAAGGDRFDTAAAVADLLAAYNPAYLPIDMQAIDADTVDGKHASEFASAADLEEVSKQTGPEGPQGPAGPAGVSGYDHVYELHEVLGGDFESLEVSCPGEKLPLSGGYEIFSGDASITADHVIEYGGGGLAYRVGVNAASNTKITVHVICAHVD